MFSPGFLGLVELFNEFSRHGSTGGPCRTAAEEITFELDEFTVGRAIDYDGKEKGAVGAKIEARKVSRQLPLLAKLP